MRVKICGLTDAASLHAAIDAGAAYIGLNFFPRSPRSVSPEQANALALETPPGVMKVALAVNPDDALVDTLSALPIDMIQLHGDESPERAAAVRARAGLPVMKAVGVAVAADLDAADAYAGVVDQLLIDAKPPPDGVLPGGNGVAFDWRLIVGREFPLPWMLAGGLNPDNVAEAVRLTGARQVDVASGVESAPGIKDPDLMRAFVQAAGA